MFCHLLGVREMVTVKQKERTRRGFCKEIDEEIKMINVRVKELNWIIIYGGFGLAFSGVILK